MRGVRLTIGEPVAGYVKLYMRCNVSVTQSLGTFGKPWKSWIVSSLEEDVMRTTSDSLGGSYD